MIGYSCLPNFASHHGARRGVHPRLRPVSLSWAGPSRPTARIEVPLQKRANYQPAVGLFVEPGVFEASALVIAVDHHRVPLEIGLPASRQFRIEERRTRCVLGELALDPPDDLLAFADIGLARLLVDQLIDLGIAMAGVIALGAA
jgi:hypothetical protein